VRPLKNGNFCSSSRKAKISTTGIYRIFRGLKFEPDEEIGQKVPFYKGLRLVRIASWWRGGQGKKEQKC
jgi:hypothetical protein